MSAAIDDGGPIHPGQWYDFQPTTGIQVVREQWQGMSLRDWFAGQALAGLRSNSDESGGVSAEDLAECAYIQADAMIAARKATE